MLAKSDISKLLTDLAGKEYLLYSDDSNPYESIYIRAKVADSRLMIVDSECEHAPDGGWSFRTISFDEENTYRAFSFLTEEGEDPMLALKKKITYRDRTNMFLRECDARKILYINRLSF